MKMNSSSLIDCVLPMVVSVGISGVACASMFVSNGRFEAFKIGLKQDRSAAPQTSYLDAPTLATFQKAFRELGNQ